MIHKEYWIEVQYRLVFTGSYILGRIHDVSIEVPTIFGGRSAYDHHYDINAATPQGPVTPSDELHVSGLIQDQRWE
jgi:hypothetical protein